MMNRNMVATILVFALSASTAYAQENELGWTMESALKQIDRQANDMETVLAQVAIEWSGDEQGMERIKGGRIYINKRGDFRISDSSPAKRVLLVERGNLHLYDPTAAQVTNVKLSREKARLEPYIRIGFTVTGRELTDDFLVTFIGEQEIGDRRVLGLELTPKKDAVRAVVSKLTIWFDQASWLPVRQTLAHTSGTQTVTIDYSGVARNLQLNPKLFKADWPKGTKKVRN
jgi:outer membrane lipoprotein-sorting protein